MIRDTGEGWYSREDLVNDLADHGFIYSEHYVIMDVPNIVDITYGRGVGYTFTEEVLPKEIQAISATAIRAERSAS